LKKENKNSLAGCVILYNPANSVIKNINSYINYIDILYVVDNSAKGNIGLVDMIDASKLKIIYISEKENIGIAAALNIAARLAVNDSYDWLLTMDQDSCFFGQEFFSIWKTENQNEGIGLMAASYTNYYDRWQKKYSNHFNEIHFIITSGNIINLKAWERTRGFEDKLFIDEVDHDYCLKLRENKYKILISKNKLMDHEIGEFYDTKNVGLKVNRLLNLHNPVRYYYISRNVLYICRKYFFTDFKFVSARFYYLIKTLAKIILRYPDKTIYLKFFFAGFRDFSLSKYNKYDGR